MTEQLTFAFPSTAVDPDTASLLELIDGDPLHETDRAAVIDAILAVARAHGGEINPNLVRERIPRSVYHRVVGSTYRSLTQRGIIAVAGWVVSEDKHGRNSGKPARKYRLVRMIGGAA